MKIKGLGYRELKRLGEILEEIGRTGEVDGVAFDCETLEIIFDMKRDVFVIADEQDMTHIKV